MIVKRKWGFYITLISAMQFKVKILYFKPGAAISMQRHNHRNELWCFLSGMGLMKTKVDGAPAHLVFDRRKGETCIVNRFTWHQYTALKQTVVLEIQYGGKCSEDDIERE